MARSKPLHERRKVTFAELGAMYGTRAMLAAHDLVKAKYTRERWSGDSVCLVQAHVHQFDMATPLDMADCGTVGCIGGHMALIMGTNGVEYVNFHNCMAPGEDGYDAIGHSHALHDLFFPPRDLVWSSITPKHAIKAIDNWLRTGRPGWRKIAGIKHRRSDDY